MTIKSMRGKMYILDLLYLLRSEQMIAELDEEYEYAQEIVDSSFDHAEQYIALFRGSTLDEMEDWIMEIIKYYTIGSYYDAE